MTLLLHTKLRRKLLSYSFTHSDEDYYVRELSSLIEEDPGNLSRELRTLEQEGLYTSVTRGRVKLYSLNKKYPLFRELKKIIFKTAGVEGTLKEVMGRFKGVSIALIYGSYARDREKKTSDIDLIAVGKFPRNKFTREIRNLELKLGREINFTVYTQEEFEMERRKEGGFLNLILKERVVILKGSLNVGKTNQNV